MGTRVAVYGAGGHGHDIAATLDDFAGFIDDNPDLSELPALGDYELLLGMNDPQVRYGKWRMTLGFRWHNDGVWVHPAANLGPSVKLGQHTHVNAGAFLTRCAVGEFCTIAPNATVLGDVTLGDRVFVGANATIRNLVSVCSNVVIGAGAVVTKDITEPGTYVGVPAVNTLPPCYRNNGPGDQDRWQWVTTEPMIGNRRR